MSCIAIYTRQIVCVNIYRIIYQRYYLESIRFRMIPETERIKNIWAIHCPAGVYLFPQHVAGPGSHDPCRFLTQRVPKQRSALLVMTQRVPKQRSVLVLTQRVSKQRSSLLVLTQRVLKHRSILVLTHRAHKQKSVLLPGTEIDLNEKL